MKLIALLALLASTCPLIAADNSKAETKYVSFQVQTGLYGVYAGPPPMPGHFALS